MFENVFDNEINISSGKQTVSVNIFNELGEKVYLPGNKLPSRREVDEGAMNILLRILGSDLGISYCQIQKIELNAIDSKSYLYDVFVKTNFYSIPSPYYWSSNF